MCNFLSLVVTQKGEVFSSGCRVDQSHETLVREHGLDDSKPLRVRDFVRVEISFRDKPSLSPSDAVFRIDEEDSLPVWWLDRVVEFTQRCWDEWGRVVGQCVFLDGVHEVKDGIVDAYGNSTVDANGNSTVYANGNSTVYAYGNSTVYAYGNSTVYANGNSTVYAYGNSTVDAYGNSTVYAYGNSTVVANDNSTVYANGNSTVVANDNSTVDANGNSTVYAYGNSTVDAYGNSTVYAYGNSTFNLYQYATAKQNGILYYSEDIKAEKQMRKQS